jgi:hypothetical protein
MKSSALDEPTSWSRGSGSLSDGYKETNREGLARSPSAPDELTHRQCIASVYVREPQRLSDVGGASDEPVLLKSRCQFI